MSQSTRARVQRAAGPPLPRKLLSLQDAADRAGVNPKTIRRRIADGSLKGYRMGPRLIRVDLNELDALLQPIPSAGGAA